MIPLTVQILSSKYTYYMTLNIPESHKNIVISEGKRTSYKYYRNIVLIQWKKIK